MINTDCFKSINSVLKKNIDLIEYLYFSGPGDSTDVTAVNQYGCQMVNNPSPLLIKIISSNLNKVFNLIGERQTGVLVYSKIYSAELIVLGMMSYIADINFGYLCKGFITDEEWPRLTMAVEILNRRNMLFYDRQNSSLKEVIKSVTRISSKYNIGVLATDCIAPASKLQKTTGTIDEFLLNIDKLKVPTKKNQIKIVILANRSNLREQ